MPISYASGKARATRTVTESQAFRARFFSRPRYLEGFCTPGRISSRVERIVSGEGPFIDAPSVLAR
jgi:hypothetical protein